LLQRRDFLQALKALRVENKASNGGPYLHSLRKISELRSLSIATLKSIQSQLRSDLEEVEKVKALVTINQNKCTCQRQINVFQANWYGYKNNRIHIPYYHYYIVRCCTEKRQQSAWFAKNKIVRLLYPAIIMWSARHAPQISASVRTVRLQLSQQVKFKSFLRICYCYNFCFSSLKEKRMKKRSRKLWKNIMWVILRFCEDLCIFTLIQWQNWKHVFFIAVSMYPQKYDWFITKVSTNIRIFIGVILNYIDIFLDTHTHTHTQHTHIYIYTYIYIFSEYHNFLNVTLSEKQR